jgi:hypothetical protein
LDVIEFEGEEDDDDAEDEVEDEAREREVGGAGGDASVVGWESIEEDHPLRNTTRASGLGASVGAFRKGESVACAPRALGSKQKQRVLTRPVDVQYVYDEATGVFTVTNNPLADAKVLAYEVLATSICGLTVLVNRAVIEPS